MLIEALAKHVLCMCVSAWKVNILLCIRVTNQCKAEPEFNIDGHFDLVVCTLSWALLPQRHEGAKFRA